MSERSLFRTANSLLPSREPGGSSESSDSQNDGEVFIERNGRGDASTRGLRIVNQIGDGNLEIAAQRRCRLDLVFVAPPECDPVESPALLLQEGQVLVCLQQMQKKAPGEPTSCSDFVT